MAIYKLGDIGKFKGGISTLDKLRYDKGINFVNYMDVFQNSTITLNSKLRKYDATKSDIEKYNLIYGDALFTASSELPNEIAISSIYLSNKKAIFNGFCKRFRYNHRILIPKYAAYLFRSNKFRSIATRYATGYTRYNISQESLNKINFNIPSINEQQKIIDIIEPIEKIISLLEKIEKNIFTTTIIGNKMKLKNFSTSISNGYAYKNSDKSNDGKYKIFTIKNIKNNKFQKTNLIKNNLTKIGDFITGLSGTIGTSTIIKNKNYVTNQRTLLIRTKHALEMMICVKKNKKYILNISTGAVQKNIKSTDILNVKMSIPNIEHSLDRNKLFLLSKIIQTKIKSLKQKMILLLIK